MTLGERIREQRKNAGLSQEKVAELVGVSRQAVTKWESGQSAPSTENLFKLAEIFGTTVDILLSSDKEEAPSPAEQIYYLYKMEQEKTAEQRRHRWKANAFVALAVLGGYILIFFAGHFFRTSDEPVNGLWWLIGTSHLPYLIGWLLKRNLFWLAMAVSAVPALFGKKYFAMTTLFGFEAGLIVGELCGHNPAGAAYGYGHYGWAIWGGCFAYCIAMGIVLEKLIKRKPAVKKQALWIWSVILIGGIFAIVAAVRAGMPTRLG